MSRGYEPTVAKATIVDIADRKRKGLFVIVSVLRILNLKSDRTLRSAGSGYRIVLNALSSVSQPLLARALLGLPYLIQR